MTGSRVTVARPLVELRGDEMARLMWDMVREELVLPFVDLELVSFDLALSNRDATEDAVTHEAAAAVREHGVGAKCATITPNAAQMAQYSLQQQWRSPNATIRKALRGVIFREPVVIDGVPRLVPGWTEPIVIARHAHGDQYQATDFAVPGKGTLTLTFTPAGGGEPIEREVARFGDDGGVAMGMFNYTDSITDFARACLAFGLSRGLPVFLSTKDTVLKSYDGAFRDIFAAVFEEEFATAYDAAGITYEHRLIDDMVASALKWPGGYLWACKNYDGDVQTDVVAQGFGSPGLMSSVLTSPDGRIILTEAAHGTVARHYRSVMAGEEPSTNPIGTVTAWSRALAHRGRLDGTPDVVAIGELIERAVSDTVRAGVMTPDLAALVGDVSPVGTAAFIAAVASRVAAGVALV